MPRASRECIYNIARVEAKVRLGESVANRQRTLHYSFDPQPQVIILQ